MRNFSHFSPSSNKNDLRNEQREDLRIRNDLCSAMLISMINNLFYYIRFPIFPTCVRTSVSENFLFSLAKRRNRKGHDERKASNDSTSHLMGFSAVSNSRLSKVVNLLTIPLSIPSLSRQIDKYSSSEKRELFVNAKQGQTSGIPL